MKQPRIKRGEGIKATFLNKHSQGIDDLTDQAVQPPEQLKSTIPVDVQNEDPDADDLDTYIEQARTISEVQVFDQNDENYATIERITTITFLNGRGKPLKLRINN